MIQTLLLALAASASFLAPEPVAHSAAPPAATVQEPSPATLLERAAYAEEHARDFDAAEELFQKALESATAAQDAKVAEEARAGLERVRARRDASAPTEADDALLERIASLMNVIARVGVSTQQLSQAQRDLALFGSHAAPWAKAAAGGRVQVAGVYVSGNAERFVRVIALMTGAQGLEALDELARSPDPVIRRAVARHARLEPQIAILTRLVEDELEEIRTEAVKGLAAMTGDASLEPVMARAMARGDRNAARWLRNHRPQAIAGMLRDAATSEKARLAAIVELLSIGYGYDEAVLEVLLAFARSESFGNRQDAASLLQEFVEGNWQPLPADVASRLERELAPLFEREPGRTLLELLLAVGGVDSLTLVAPHLMVEAGRDFLDLGHRLAAHLARYETADAVGLARALEKMSAQRGAMESDGALQMRAHVGARLKSLVREEDASEALIAELVTILVGDERVSISSLVVEWLESRYRPSGPRSAGERPQPLDPILLPLVRELSRAGHPRWRAAAVLGFGATGSLTELPELIALSRDAQGEVSRPARGAVAALIRRDPVAAAGALRAALSSDLASTGELRMDLVLTFGAFPPEMALELFREFWPLARNDHERSELVQILLNLLPDPGATALLLELYPEIPRAPLDMRIDAIASFGGMLHEPAIPLLGEALRDPNVHLRTAAQQAFEQFREHREMLAEFDEWLRTDAEQRATVEELAELLADPRPAVRLGAVQALGRLRARSAAPALVRLLGEADEELRAAIHAALAEL